MWNAITIIHLLQFAAFFNGCVKAVCWAPIYCSCNPSVARHQDEIPLQTNGCLNDHRTQAFRNQKFDQHIRKQFL